jgi:hypothetical protein
MVGKTISFNVQRNRVVCRSDLFFLRPIGLLDLVV